MLARRAAVGRRRRRLGLCRQCGYDLRGSPTGRCSECGAEAFSEPARHPALLRRAYSSPAGVNPAPAARLGRDVAPAPPASGFVVPGAGSSLTA